MRSRTGTAIGGALALVVVACWGGSVAARASDGAADLERLLAAENGTAFEAVETTTDYLSDGTEVHVTSHIFVAEGRRIEKIVDTNVPVDREGSRGSQYATGPADVETLPVPLFPDGVSDIPLLTRNYDLTPIGDDNDSGWRVAPRHHSGYPLEVVVDPASGLWRKITVFGHDGHPRVTRVRESIKVLSAPDPARLEELRKKGRPAIATSGAAHADETISADEARRRLPGFILPVGTVLGFSVDRIESVTDGGSGSEAIVTTLRDGLLTLVLAETIPVGPNNMARPRDGAGSSSGEGSLTVQKSVDRSDSGVSLYQWTDRSGIAMLLVSPLTAADTRQVIQTLLGGTAR